MLKTHAVKKFETLAGVAKALGVTYAAVWQWGDVVPELSARKLQDITNGELKVDPKLYRRAKSKSSDCAPRSRGLSAVKRA